MTIHQMDILDATGHTTIAWDPAKPEEVKTARDAFDKMTSSGRYRALDEEGNRVDTFKPALGSLTLVPHLVGG